jgi:hypothetical protein
MTEGRFLEEAEKWMSSSAYNQLKNSGCFRAIKIQSAREQPDNLLILNINSDPSLRNGAEPADPVMK